MHFKSWYICLVELVMARNKGGCGGTEPVVEAAMMARYVGDGVAREGKLAINGYKVVVDQSRSFVRLISSIVQALISRGSGRAFVGISFNFT